MNSITYDLKAISGEKKQKKQKRKNQILVLFFQYPPAGDVRIAGG